MVLGKIILKIFYIFYFFLYYLCAVILANFEVAWEVLSPKHMMTPGIVAIPLDLKSDMAITLLANLITMTPGTMSVDVSADRKVLYVYGLHIKDLERFRTGIKNKLEKKVQRIFQ